jgi:hypothetical protein
MNKPKPTPSRRTKVPVVGRTLQAAHALAQAGSTSLARADELRLTTNLIGAPLPAIGVKILIEMVRRAGGDAWQDRVWTISREEIRDLTGWHFTRDELDKLLDALATQAVKVLGTSRRDVPMWKRRPIFAELRNERDFDTAIEYELSAGLRALLARSQHYTVLDVAVMAAMSSKYALILYEIGKQRLRMPDFSWEGTVGELRELLGVGKGKMLNWTDLRKRTLDAAAKDLDDLAPFTMRIEETRHGRTVKRVRLLFISKDDDAAAAAARLVHATKLERKARRGHGVETVIGPALSAEEERRIAALRAELPPLDLADDLDDAIPY